MLVVNCLFRLGGAAALMSNRAGDARRAKYVLTDTERTHLGCEDSAFGCMGNGEDAEGVMGVFLKKNVVEVAGKALKENITALGPRVLPVGELIKCARDKSYVPDFKKVGVEGRRKEEGLARAARRARGGAASTPPLFSPLAAGFRALFAPHRRPRRHRRARESARPHRGAGQAVQGHPLPLWQHVGRVHVVHSGQHRAHRGRQEGRPRVAARLRRRVQMQLGLLEGAQDAAVGAPLLGGVLKRWRRGAAEEEPSGGAVEARAAGALAVAARFAAARRGARHPPTDARPFGSIYFVGRAGRAAEGGWGWGGRGPGGNRAAAAGARARDPARPRQARAGAWGRVGGRGSKNT